MEAIVNCTVVRDHPVRAFDVNVRGAYNVMQAAVRQGIKRIVHTGPQVAHSYRDDFNISSDALPRPGLGLYPLTKYVAMELCRVFAEAHHLEVVCLLFSSFIDPTADHRPGGQDTYSFLASWADTGQAFHRALVAENLPSPFEVFNIISNLPHGKYSLTKARHLLGYEPQDDLVWLWTRRGLTPPAPLS
jgi:nucleoside-diphosphate-sugar epimerase